MKKLFIIAWVCLAAISPLRAQKGGNTQVERLKHNLYWLADDSLRGRKAGSDDALKAAEYIIGQYKEMGALPFWDDYLIGFSLPQVNSKAAQAYALIGDTTKHYRDIAVVIPGNDPSLRHEYILVGAHYDHLGVKNGRVYNGADDNASGTVAVIEMARKLIARKSELRRSVVIVNFDAEEIGLLGSTAMVDLLSGFLSPQESPIIFRDLKEDEMFCPLLHCRAMMSIDMVGWLRQSGELVLEGSATLEKGGRTIKEVAEKCGIKVKAKGVETSVFTATDTEPFARWKIPTLAVTTGIKSPYHKPEDDAELIDYEGLSLVVDYLTELTIGFAADKELEASGRIAPKHENRMPAFEMGLTLCGGRDWANFSHGALTTHPGWGWDGGVSLLLNIMPRHNGKDSDITDASFFGSMHASALYDRFKMPYPSFSNPIYNQQKYGQCGFLFPVSLRANAYLSGLSIYLGAGGYYEHLLEAAFSSGTAPYDVYNSQWGWLWEIGLRVGRWDISAMSGYEMSRMLRANTVPAPDALLRWTRLNITRYLW